MLGELLPPPPGGARGWTLPQVVDRMRGAYCGTLAVELDHLYSSVCTCRASQMFCGEMIPQFGPCSSTCPRMSTCTFITSQQSRSSWY